MKPYIIRISSFKGGVGKTTVAVNLAVSLQRMGYETLLMDVDTTNPSVGIHLGMSEANIGTKEFISGKATLTQATSVHGATGLHVVVGTLNEPPYFAKPEWIQHGYSTLGKSTAYQFIILDSAPGFTPAQQAGYVDEALIISTPDIPSLTSAVKLEAFYNKHRMNHKMLVNRVDNRRYEVHPKEISEIYEGSIMGFLPEDEIVPKSIAAHIPAIVLDRKALFSKALHDVSDRYAVNSAELDTAKIVKGGWLNRVGRRFRRTR